MLHSAVNKLLPTKNENNKTQVSGSFNKACSKGMGCELHGKVCYNLTNLGFTVDLCG
jgi:hypothetical protein